MNMLFLIGLLLPSHASATIIFADKLTAINGTKGREQSYGVVKVDDVARNKVDMDGVSEIILNVQVKNQGGSMQSMCLAIGLYNMKKGSQVTLYGDIGPIGKMQLKTIQVSGKLRTDDTIGYYDARYIECEWANMRYDYKERGLGIPLFALESELVSETAGFQKAQGTKASNETAAQKSAGQRWLEKLMDFLR
ncbi:MAG: hypothetical protein AAB320_01135 [Elusimicrobiota bacterium]